MQVTISFAASVFAALLAGGSVAVAQLAPTPETLPPFQGLPPMQELPPLDELPPAGPPQVGQGGWQAMPDAGDLTGQAREAHLDALFTQLADPGNEHWQRAQAQIYAVWGESGSASMDLLAMRADQAMEAQEMDVALSFLNDLVRLAPDFAEGWNKRATIYFLRDEYARSLGDIARTIELEPRHFGAWAGLGIILDRLGDKKGALEAYRRASEIHPHLPGAAEGIRKLTREVEGERT